VIGGVIALGAGGGSVPFGHFIGIGVSDCADAACGRLEHAIGDVEALRELLDGGMTCSVLSDPGETEVRDFLLSLQESMPARPLAVVWSGHGRPSPVDGLRLLAKDSRPGAPAGIGPSELVGWCAESGANQLLFVIDTCFAGAAVPVVDIADKILQAAPPPGTNVWVGVLASCLDVETARDGLFGKRFLDVLQNGPHTPVLKVRGWSAYSQYVRGDDVCDAVLKEWDSDVQRPTYRTSGSAWWMFLNPFYDPGAPDQVVEHLLQAARGGASADERSWFTGRTLEVDMVVGWVRSGEPGIHVVTGPAGTGKTAIVGRVVSLSNHEERERLLGEGLTWEHDDPGEKSVHAHLHARALTADRAAALLAGQLVANWVLPQQQDPRNAAELVGQVQRLVEAGARPPVLVIDGLDEARSEAFAIAEKLLVALAPHAVIVVSTRELRREQGEPSLIETLALSGPELDLGEPTARERTQADLAAYVRGRLAGVAEHMDPDKIAHLLAGDAS
jgi:hypothetical protein